MAAAAELRYEDAAELRDRVQAIEATLERQRVHDPEGGDFDVAGLVRLGDRVGVSLLRVRAGRLIGTEAFSLRDPLEGEGGGEAIAGFLRDCYAAGREVPPEVVVAEAPAGVDAVREWLARARGAAVRIVVPRAGSRRALLAMAGRNAMRLLQEEKAGAAGGDAVLDEVGRLAGPAGTALARLPRRLEPLRHRRGRLARLVGGRGAPPPALPPLPHPARRPARRLRDARGGGGTAGRARRLGLVDGTGRGAARRRPRPAHRG